MDELPCHEETIYILCHLGKRKLFVVGHSSVMKIGSLNIRYQDIQGSESFSFMAFNILWLFLGFVCGIHIDLQIELPTESGSSLTKNKLKNNLYLSFYSHFSSN